jgi:hypothetical protein
MEKITLADDREIYLFAAASVLTNFKKTFGKSMLSGFEEDDKQFEEKLFFIVFEAARAGCKIKGEKFDYKVADFMDLLSLSDAIEQVKIITAKVAGTAPQKKTR